jgi:group I intron endonuclease
LNGKLYIGSAVNLRKRFSSHRRDLAKGRHHSIHLQRAWYKHGADAFKFLVIEKVDDPDRLLEREQHYLDLHQSANRERGYNVNVTAGSRLGMTNSPEAIARVVAANRGRIPSEETRAMMSAAKQGKKRKPFSAEHLRNLTVANGSWRKRPTEGQIMMSFDDD